MKSVDNVGSGVYSGVETECNACAPDIIVNSLWQTDNIKSLFGKKSCGLGSAGSAKWEQAVEWRRLVYG